MFALGFGTDGEGVEDAGGEGVANRFGGFVAEVALAEDFHADDALSLRAHLLEDGNDGGGVGVHVGADGVKADEVDLDPGRGRSGMEGGKAVAGDAVGADDSFLLGLGEDVHDGAVAGGPVGLSDAVDKDDVNVVDAEFLAEAVEVVADALRVAGVSFGEDGDLVARKLLEGGGDVRMAAVGIGGVEEAKAVVVVAVEEEFGKGECSKLGLVGATTAADGAGAHGEAAGADAGFAENDLVVCGELFAEGFGIEEGGAGSGGAGEDGGGRGAGGATKKVSAEHGGSLLAEQDTPVAVTRERGK